ncbi:MAG: dockerin type I repeat-containing protein [Ruminococcus sp.]|nr:dockerin type I repeat-containing protein [Ruminococcus sp.]
MKFKKIISSVLAVTMCITSFSLHNFHNVPEFEVSASDLSELPAEYKSAADWIWNTRIQGEKSVEAWDTIYDKIVAGNGTLHYVVRWQTDKSITLEQRQNLQKVLEKSVNDWTDNLVGYENWQYSHVNVKIVGWAVLDKNCLLDLQPDETVYTDTSPYDPTYDIQSGMGDSRIPTLMPEAPIELFRYEHWRDPDWSYNGSYENRYDMQLTATLGMINMGGYGYYWGQQLSDEAVLGLADGSTSVHILEHEVGHGFGFTDFYGGEGESDGFPPGGFPGSGTSIMMAGSSSVITDFDAWFARYVWSKISAEEGRFNLSPAVTETTTTTTTTITISTTTTTTQPPAVNTSVAEFTDTISDISAYENSGSISFAQNGNYTFSGDEYYAGDESKNLMNYETGDIISVKFTYNTDTNEIISIEYLDIDENIRRVKGDVNADGEFSVADLVAIQNWLLAVPDISLDNWKAGDFCEDNVLDVFDLCLMRQELLNQ